MVTNPAKVSLKHADAWKEPDKIWLKDADTWKEPVGGWVNVSGTWQKFWPKVIAAPCDPYFGYVVYLSGYEGADAATTTIDEATGKTVTTVGNAQIDTAQFKFGSSALLLDGAGDYLTLADHEHWTIGANQFTVEAWVRPAIATSKQHMIIAQASTTSQRQFYFFVDEVRLMLAISSSGITVTSIPTAGFTFAPNTWYHVAADRDAAGKIRLYINGVMYGSAVDTSTLFSSTGALEIGRLAFNTPTADFQGHLDEVRFTNGIARYASDAGFAVPTAAFPRIPCPAQTLDLNFLTMAPTLDPRITFSRASIATYFDVDGLLKYAANNRALQSQTFNTSWTGVNGGTITPDAAIAPDGTLTADRLNHVTAGTVTSGGIQQVVGTAVTTDMWSCYAKAGTKTWLLINHSSIGFAQNECYFDLVNGVVGNKGSTWLSSGISSVGNGWYRCWAVLPPGVGSTFNLRVAETANNYQSTSPGDIYIWGAQAEQVTIETSPRTYIPTTTAAVHAPRFDYDPVTHAPKGLLIEEQKQVNTIFTEDFTNANWIKTGCTITGNNTTAPDGTVNADLVTASATTATVSQTVPAASNYIASIFIKKGTSDWIYMVGQVTDVPKAWFNIATGTAGTVQAGLLGTGIENIGNGWYRCWIADAFGTGAEPVTVGLCDADNSTTVTIGKTIYLWGAQQEPGAFPTSYVPNLGSGTGVRYADVATMTGANFSSWYNTSAGTFVAEFDLFSNTSGGNGRGIIAANNNTTTQIVELGVLTGNVRGLVVTSGLVFNGSCGPVTANIINKLGISYAVNDFAACLNGGTPVLDIAGAVPTPTQLQIGRDTNAATEYLNGHVRRIQFWNTALTDAELQTLTT